MSLRKCRAFTLIELLVVITIIVVLLALLTPALDKAIYQAELAVCAAQQKGGATGVLTYAFENNRTYPDRPTAGSSSGLSITTLSQNGLDDRTVLRKFMSLKTLVDPMVDEVDLDSDQGEWIQNSYYTLWFDVQFPNFGGMHKVGNRLGWDDNGVRIKSDLLISDSDTIIDSVSRYIASHPDESGIMANIKGQNQPLLLVTSNATWSYWDTGNGATDGRGGLDLNYAKDDGSVLRLDDVAGDGQDERIGAVPFSHNGSNWRTWRQQVPLR